ncbi:MAG: hypothetical protein KKG21_00145 [Candidatus Omnitrophica bacterium]|nr:hypothetical protein [Candidatus Omnitrophota bacterium]
MKNNSYNLRNIFLIGLAVLLLCPLAGADDSGEKDSYVVGTVEDEGLTWYAIIKIGGRKKLHTKGDIFCSRVDITDCLRIQEIRKDEIVLKDVKSDSILTVRPGISLPLKGSDIIYEKSIASSVIEYRYKDSKAPSDFSISAFNEKKIVMQKYFDKKDLSEDVSNGAEVIKNEFFEDIEIEKIEKDIWVVNRESAEKAIDNAGRSLFSVIKKVRPECRFGKWPSLRFNCALGDLVLNKEGFLVQNLAVARLVERAGIKKGDLIKSVNGQPVNSLFGIFKSYMNIKSNKDVKVVKVDIIRDERPQTLTYKVR